MKIRKFNEAEELIDDKFDTNIELSSADCRLFNSTWDLVGLLRDEKINLNGKLLSYNSEDDVVVKILDKYFTL